jgi:hypothetical protein
MIAARTLKRASADFEIASAWVGSLTAGFRESVAPRIAPPVMGRRANRVASSCEPRCLLPHVGPFNIVPAPIVNHPLPLV